MGGAAAVLRARSFVMRWTACEPSPSSPQRPSQPSPRARRATRPPSSACWGHRSRDPTPPPGSPTSSTPRYYRRPEDQRDVDDLRLAFAILTTYWDRHGPGGSARSTPSRFHRAFGARPLPDGHRQRAARHAGPRAAARRRRAPARRLVPGGLRRPRAPRLGHRLRDGRRARGATTRRAACAPPRSARSRRRRPRRRDEQVWHTYAPVAMPSAEGVVAALTRPETWPDYATRARPLHAAAAGRARGPDLRDRGRGRHRAPAARVYTRGYVTITRLVTPDDPEALRDWFDDARGRPGPLRRATSRRAFPEGADAARRLRPHDARGPLHGLRAQPARSSTRTTARPWRARRRARGTRCRGTLDQAYRRAGQRRAARVLGRGRDAALSHAAPARAAAGGPSGVKVDARRHRRGPERARGRDPARRGRPLGARARGRRPRPAARSAPRS